MKSGSISIWSFSSVFFFGLFLLIGLLNIWYVNPLIGGAYIALSMFYLPGIDKVISSQLHISIPRGLKYLVAILVLWGTLAVGDLFELFESWMLS